MVVCIGCENNGVDCFKALRARRVACHSSDMLQDTMDTAHCGMVDIPVTQAAKGDGSGFECARRLLKAAAVL